MTNEVASPTTVDTQPPVPLEHKLFKQLRPAMKVIALAFPARLRERIGFRVKLGYWPHIRNPRTFNEKMCWRKWYDRSDLFVTLSDKIAVRDYVEQRLGQEYLTELYAVTDDPSSIDFDALPDSFVAKGSHDSGSVKIIRDKGKTSKTEFIASLQETMAKSGRKQLHNEWWYNQIKPRIMFEELLWDRRHGVPHDYKLFCFNGRVEMIVVDEGRFENHLRSFYSRDWQLLPLVAEYPAAPLRPVPPSLHQLMEAAERLAAGVDFVRVDLYAVDDERIVFGEMTFAPWGGWAPFEPISWDASLGKLWPIKGRAAK